MQITLNFQRRLIAAQISKMSWDTRPDETLFREDRGFIDMVLDDGNPLVCEERMGFGCFEVLKGIKDSIDKQNMIKVKIHGR